MSSGLEMWLKLRDLFFHCTMELGVGKVYKVPISVYIIQLFQIVQQRELLRWFFFFLNNLFLYVQARSITGQTPHPQGRDILKPVYIVYLIEMTRQRGVKLPW